MPRTTPVKELQAEDKSEGAPRRSSRIAQNSPAPSAVVQRRNSASNNDTPAKLTRAKRLSLSQENGTDSMEGKLLLEASNPDTPRRGRLTRSASKSPTALAKAAETKPAAVKTRGRRGSQSKTAEEEKILDSPAPQNIRRRSTRSESTSPTSVKDAEPAKPKTRRGSITDKINPLEKIDEVSLTASEPKKRVRGRRSSLTDMPQLDVIEETKSDKKEKDKKIDLESITEAAEAEEKNAPSTSSTMESKIDEKSIGENKIDKFNLSAVVKIEKTKTMTNLTTNSNGAETSTTAIENKTKDHEETSSEPNSNEATSSVSPMKLSTAEGEDNMETNNKAPEQTSIDKIEEELEILLNENENQNSDSPKQLNKTFENQNENKVETHSSTTTIDISKEYGNEKAPKVLDEKKDPNIGTSTSIVPSTNVHLDEAPPNFSSENEALNNQVDSAPQVDTSELNETKFINDEDDKAVQLSAKDSVETSSDIICKIQLKPLEESTKDNESSQRSENDQTTIKEGLKEKSESTEISKEDERTKDILPNLDNIDSSESTNIKDYHNKSLTNLLPEQLDMTTGSDGSFHINLCAQNICSSKEDIAESPKKETSNTESDILNKSDSSDKENAAVLNQITEDVTKTKSPLIEKKPPLTDKSLNENNKSTKSLDVSCEPMDVDDPPLSYIDVTDKSHPVHAKKRSSTPNKKSQNSVEFSDAFVNESLNTIDDSEIEDHQKDKTGINNDAVSETNVEDTTEINKDSENVDVQNLILKEGTTVAGTTNNEKHENKTVVDEQTKENDYTASKDVERQKWKEDGYASPVFSIDSGDETDDENVNVLNENKRKKQHEKIQDSISTSEEKQSTLELDSIVEVRKPDVTDNICKEPIGDNAVADDGSADEAIEVIDEISKENVTALKSTPSKMLTPQKDLHVQYVNTKSPSTPSKGKEDIIIEISSSPKGKGSPKSVEKKRASLKKVEAESGTKSKSPSKKMNIMEFAVDSEKEDHTSKATKSTPTKTWSPKRSNVKSPKLLKQNTTATDEDADIDSSRDIETDALNSSPQSKHKLPDVRSDIEEKHKGHRSKSSEIGTTKEKSPKKKITKRSDGNEIRNVVTKLIKDTIDELTSSSEAENKEDVREISEFFDDMAEEGEEETPSEDSNDILYEGESINSSDTFTDDDDESYENDSFIDDEHDKHDLLSGEEDFLQDEPIGKKSMKKNKPAASGKLEKKRKRILAPSSSESEEDNQQLEKNAVNETNDEVQDSKQLEEANQEEACQNDKIEAEKAPKEVEKLTASDTNNEIGGAAENTPNSSENLVPSTNDVIDVDSSSDSESVSSVKEESKTGEDVNTSLSDKKSKRTSSITIQENIKLEDIQDGELSSRISKVVDWFYSGIKGSSDTGNISLNVSLDYADQSNEEKADDEELTSITDSKKVSKRRSEELKKNKSPEKIVPEVYEDDVFVENIEEPQESDELRLPLKKSKRKSIQKEAEKKYTDDEKMKTSTKRLSDESIEHISPKKNKYDFDFVVEDIVTIDDKKKKKTIKSKNKADTATVAIVKSQERTQDENVPKKRKRLYLEMMNIPELLNRDNEKPNDAKIKKKQITPLSVRDNLHNVESVKKIDKLGTLKKKKTHLSEFNVEFDDSKKSKKLICTTEKADHVPSSSGFLKKRISTDTHVSKHEVNEAKETAKKLKRKISRKLLPTKSTGSNDSWESELFDRTLHPSKSNKRMVDVKTVSRKTKTDIDSFNSKDFKNKMLYDSNRIKRMDTKALLRQRKKV